MISELFSWSAEARIIQSLIDSRMEDDEFWFGLELSQKAGVHPRTLRTRINRLVELKIAECKIMFDKMGRKQKAYRLADSEVVSKFIQLESVLIGEVPNVD